MSNFTQRELDAEEEEDMFAESDSEEDCTVGKFTEGRKREIEELEPFD